MQFHLLGAENGQTVSNQKYASSPQSYPGVEPVMAFKKPVFKFVGVLELLTAPVSSTEYIIGSKWALMTLPSLYKRELVVTVWNWTTYIVLLPA